MPEATPAPPFRYLAGDPSLDLVNTVDWTDQGLRAERLSDYGDLLTWAEGAGILAPSDPVRLRRRSGSHRDDAARVVTEARKVRQLIRELSIGVAEGKVDRDLLERFNQLARKAQSHRHLAPADRKVTGLTWSWAPEQPSLELPLWAAVLAASSLLSSPDAARIRVCEGPVCGWMYVDRSRNGLRRWCAMDMCGGKEKARRHYARVKRNRES